ncbi:MFS transporter [Paenibacillus chartarius]|uniref:MFS transporter n=1 Tax=Paenibacillus chartarius TaxID=747481 RepID=A0ABV6DF22_9BACL
MNSVSSAASPSVPNALVRVLSLTLFFSVMNATMFNIAVPDIAKQFSLLPSQVGWVVTGYSIIYAVGSLTYGKLADMYPLRRLITVGMTLFALGSVVGFLSQGYAMVIIARVLQSAGASCVPALAMLIPTRYFPPEGRGRVLGIVASTIAFSAGIGPIVGGLVTGTLGWRYLFLLSVLPVVTIPLYRRYLPPETAKPGKIDVFGAMLIGGAVATLLLVITRFSWPLLIIQLLLDAAAVFWMLRSPDPFVQAKLLRNNSYRSGLLTAFLANGAVFGVSFTTPLMLEGVNHLRSELVGLVMFPGAMSAAVMGWLGGQWADRKGTTPMILTALSMLIGGYFLLSTFTGISPWLIAVCLIVVNVGYSFIQASLAKVIGSTLPREQTGVGMGMYNLTTFLAGAVSGAAVSRILDAGTAGFHLNPAALSGDGAIFSNVYVGLCLVTVINLALFYRSFRGRAPGASAIEK